MLHTKKIITYLCCIISSINHSSSVLAHNHAEHELEHIQKEIKKIAWYIKKREDDITVHDMLPQGKKDPETHTYDNLMQTLEKLETTLNHLEPKTGKTPKHMQLTQNVQTYKNNLAWLIKNAFNNEHSSSIQQKNLLYHNELIRTQQTCKKTKWLMLSICLLFSTYHYTVVKNIKKEHTNPSKNHK